MSIQSRKITFEGRTYQLTGEYDVRQDHNNTNGKELILEAVTPTKKSGSLVYRELSSNATVGQVKGALDESDGIREVDGTFHEIVVGRRDRDTRTVFRLDRVE